MSDELEDGHDDGRRPRDLIIAGFVVLGIAITCLYSMGAMSWVSELPVIGNLASGNEYTDAERTITRMIRADEVEFSTLVPCPIETFENPGDVETISEHRYPIVDSRIVKDSETVKKLLVGLLGKKGDAMAACGISPRHALRFPGSTDDVLLVCFQCNVFAHADEWLTGSLSMSANSTHLYEFKALVEKLDMIPPPEHCSDWSEL